MKQVLWRGGLVGILLCSASPHMTEAAPAKGGSTSARSTPKAPALTRGNFVSLEMQTSGGFAGIQTRLLISGNNISFSQKRPGSTAADMPQESAMSNNQLDALVRLLNEARFTSIVGKYNQPNLYDGFHETVTLKLSDSKNVDRTFVVENYGDRAPASYYKVTEYLRQLQQMKLTTGAAASTATASTPAIPLVTPLNFESLKLKTMGVTGGGESTLQIVRTSPESISRYSNATLSLPNTDGKTTMHAGNLSEADFAVLFQLLNQVRFPQLAGKYEQPNLRDGSRETVTLVLKGADGKPQEFVVENYGNSAPQPFYQLRGHLQQLTQRLAATPTMDYYRVGASVSF